MHEYSIDKHPKVKIVFWIALLAITSTPIVVKWLNVAASWANVGTISLSSGAIFYFIYRIFDKWAWRISWVRRLLLVPDLNGVWNCAGVTLQQGDEKPNKNWTSTITVVQSWSKIIIRLKTESSESHSTSAAVVHEVGNGFRLRFSYQNTPKAQRPELKPHAGFCEIVFDQELKTGEGEYFTNHQRLTHGTMKLQRGDNSNVCST
jgi:hypothetical protein